MVSYPGLGEHGGVGLNKEAEQKDDGRYIIFYTFKDEGMREAEPSSKKEDAG